MAGASQPWMAESLLAHQRARFSESRSSPRGESRLPPPFQSESVHGVSRRSHEDHPCQPRQWSGVAVPMAPAQGPRAAARATARPSAVQGAGASRPPCARGARAGASCRTKKFMCLRRISTQSTPSPST
eukprot:8979725-Pyramimonas_sp.AAC.1